MWSGSEKFCSTSQVEYETLECPHLGQLQAWSAQTDLLQVEVEGSELWWPGRHWQAPQASPSTFLPPRDIPRLHTGDEGCVPAVRQGKYIILIIYGTPFTSSHIWRTRMVTSAPESSRLYSELTAAILRSGRCFLSWLKLMSTTTEKSNLGKRSK